MMDVRGKAMFGRCLSMQKYKAMDVSPVPRSGCSPIQAVVAQTIDDGAMIA
jgi:hypothetical protein